MKLTLTLKKYPSETLSSYVSRLAALNGSQYAQDFCSDLDIGWSEVLKVTDRAVDRLVKLTSLSQQELKRDSFQSQGHGSFKINDQHLERKLLCRKLVKFCPNCLQSDLDRGQFELHKRAIWEIDTIQVCPHHLIYLTVIDEPNYPRVSQDFFGIISSLNKGFAALNFTKAVSSFRFANYQSRRISGCKTNIWLDNLDFDVAARFVENLGILSVYGPNITLAKLTQEQRHLAGETGFVICEGGISSINEVLKKIQLSSESEKGGFYTDFGFFIRWLQRINDRERYSSVLNLVRSFVFENYAVQVGEKLFDVECEVHSISNWSQASDRFNVPVGKAYRVRDAVAPSKYFKVFPLNTFDRELSILKNGLRRAEAAKYLGIYPQLFDALVRSKFIVPDLDLPSLRQHFLHETLDRFVYSLVAKIGFPNDDHDGISSVSRRIKLEIAELVQVLQSGKLRKTIRSGCRNDLTSIYIDIEELKALLEPNNSKGYDRVGLKVRLRISGPTAAYLLDNQWIESKVFSKPVCGKKYTYVSENNVREFLGKYSTLGIMAHHEGTQAKHVSSRLNKLGVQPLPIPEHLSKVYSRADLPSNYM